jgi:hypothetical protein
MRLVVCGLFALAGLVGAGRALADVAPINVAPCSGKEVGAPCETEYEKAAGTCQQKTCRSYPKNPATGIPMLDASPNEYACVLCTAGTSGGTSGGATSDDGGVTAPAPSSEPDSGCSTIPPAKGVGALVVALIPMILLRRRRRL